MEINILNYGLLSIDYGLFGLTRNIDYLKPIKMKNKLQLDINRFGFMLKHDLGKYWKRVLLIIGGAFVIVTLISLLLYAVGDLHFIAHEGHTVFFPAILFWLGLFLVSFSFKDLYEDSERSFYLNLPASYLEKYLSKLILTLLVLPIVIFVMYYFYAFFYDNALAIFTNAEVNYFTLFSNNFIGVPTSFDYFLMFLVIHSVFFIGAITFRKLAFIKTLLSSFTMLVGTAGILYLLLKIILPELFTGWVIFDDPKVVPNEWFQELVTGDYCKDISYSFLCLVIPVFLWTVSYFKLTEKEA